MVLHLGMVKVLYSAVDALVDLIYVLFLLLLLVVKIDLMIGEVQIVKGLLDQLQNHVQSSHLIQGKIGHDTLETDRSATPLISLLGLLLIIDHFRSILADLLCKLVRQFLLRGASPLRKHI